MAKRQERKGDTYYRRDYYNPAGYYNHTSSAVELLPEEEAPLLKPKKIRKPKRGTKTITEDATDKSARPSLLVFIAMLIIVAGASLSVIANSYAVVQSRANNNLRNELQAMQTRTHELSAQAAQSVDLEEVERIARARLGMSEPQIHQIRFISLPAGELSTLLPEISEPSLNYTDSFIESPRLLDIISIFIRD